MRIQVHQSEIPSIHVEGDEHSATASVTVGETKIEAHGDRSGRSVTGGCTIDDDYDHFDALSDDARVTVEWHAHEAAAKALAAEKAGIDYAALSRRLESTQYEDGVYTIITEEDEEGNG